MSNNPQEKAPVPSNDTCVDDHKVEELIAYAILRARKTCNRIDAGKSTPEDLNAHVAKLLPLNNETQQDTTG